MATRTDIVTVTADTDLADLLDAAALAPIRLERNGIVYRLSREDEDTWAAPDPDQVREVLRATVGSWSDLDADELIAELYRARRRVAPGRSAVAWPTCWTRTGRSRP